MAKDNLGKVLGELEQAVAAESAGQERAWAARVGQALAGLEQALARRAALLRSPDGRVVDVDRPLLPSPGEDRKAAGLQHELEGFLQQTQVLRTQAEAAAAFRQDGRPDESAAAAARAVVPVPDFGALRDSARTLVQAIRSHENAEAELILESVNTDIGGGD